MVVRRKAAFMFLALVGSISISLGQSANASLTGSITDPSKAVIADAKVVAISSDKNIRYETTTDSTGDYHLSNLPPGPYGIEIEKSGFKKVVKPDVVLHVLDALKIDFEMTLGADSETVTVEAGAPLVNTESATVGIVVDRAFAENLPLNGRSFQNLILLTPGAVVTATAFDDQGQFSVNGQRADANYFTVDGVSANFGVTGYIAMVQSASGALPVLSASGGTNSLVSIDAMQEFRIQTSSLAPEFGRMPGAQVSIVTRSGTNDFHGTVFEYFRNSVLDASDWFVNFNGLGKPKERMNDFGGVLGGPIHRNRTFFFFSYEGLRLRQPGTLQTAVPDLASRAQVPAGLRPYLNAYPVPNGASLGGGLAQFNAGFSNPSSLDAASIRVDHAINSKLNLFGRYNYSPSHFFQRAPFVDSYVLSTTQTLDSTVHTGTVALTALITPGVSNELRANYSNHRVGTFYGLDNFGGAVPLPDSLFFPAGFTSANSSLQFLIQGAGEIAKGNFGIDEQRQVNLVDNLSLTMGAHQFKFGIDFRWLAPFTSPLVYGQFAQFTSMSAAAGGVLSGTAAFTAVHSFQANSLLSRNFSAYGEDTWKVTPRLTLTYGLRWDVNPPLKGAETANDPFTVTGLNNPATLALAARGTPLYDTKYGNVAPRVGFAWQIRTKPDWAAVLRAGFGVFYDLGQGSLGGVSSYFPYHSVRSAVLPFPLSAEDAIPPALTLNPPISVLIVADPHLSLPRTYQWNFALEQSLGNNQTLSLTYIGAIGRDLLRATNLFNPNPNFQFVSVTDNSATSDYHALQFKFQRRLSRGLQTLMAYTFSHSIDSASTDAFANYLNSPGAAGANRDRGNSDFDIRHAFTVGVTYNVPSPWSSNVARTTLGGWSLDALVLARSAPPVDLVGNILFAAGTALRVRPNVNSGMPLELFGEGYPGGKIFNGSAFIASAPGQQGNLGRNVLRGFDASQADIAVQRKFRLTERLALRFRAEFFNILNHPNFGSPTNDLTSFLFGRSTQTLANSLGSGGANGGFNPLYQIGGPRSIQLALKLSF